MVANTESVLESPKSWAGYAVSLIQLAQPARAKSRWDAKPASWAALSSAEREYVAFVSGLHFLLSASFPLMARRSLLPRILGPLRF